ncbi:MAG TPA: helix-hairpin-helix domain-containing protein [Flavipsychrobacter sp.]|nr:helix-hairpin-helix domain-containing protein [Flavipsychrobacter sp.]
MNWLKSYFSYPSAERKGIAALLIIALILLIVYATMPYFISAPSLQTDPELVAAFNKYKQEHSTGNAYDAYATNNEFSGELFLFDPNTLDSAGFIRLGLRPKTTHMLLNWRRKGKTFYKKEDLKPLYTLKDEEYNRIEPYINISSVANRPNAYTSFTTHAPLPDHIDLNATDSATIVRLNGIGPTLAHKIIQKRKALGGFVNHQQLNEIYKFPDTTFKMLRERLIIDQRAVKKFRLNSTVFEELKSHPYIGEKIAHNIIIFREGLKRYDNIEQLRQVPLMNEEIYRKIAPYFVLD